MKKIILTLALASATVFPAAAQTPVMQAYSFSTYAALPVAQRQAYVAGVLDADRSMVPFEQAHAKFARCLADTTIGQLTVLVDARVNHPVPVDNGYVPFAVHNALDADCSRRGFQP
ncbi:hypothetical protein [Burkholderia gladioli]|jgi:hypothetical protein|uniref:hypothetical protein n=1 Tax=Burkholderia gladioli TaxID=28095 RepID=UPI0016404EF4|nr:hypothetical protein [Burkholderia gladioli]